ncbi:peptidoglycan DD-metalloendopeptidase family protein [Paenibacillus sp. GCM10012307]|uniref:M23 family metallopeptidase n=1 Tax=Paenibacillus roseus TaxID=2798579 RepID=A0A934MQH7_9BACL|nr:M23 family metallopeptidase [Paenibacillus roseus]MBJ6361898.1 M23 family metallopeptidase [Paenibacillus roseus]
MSEQNKSKQKQEETPKSMQGAPSAVKASSWKRLLSKKWVTPAAFMAAAAIIVTLMWVYQGAQQQQDLPTQTSEISEEKQGDDTVVKETAEETKEVVVGEEKIQWPVLKPEDVQVLMRFYDAKATNEERQAALVHYDNTFIPNTGIDIGGANEQAFDVVAALSGKVTHVENHPLNGNVVEITHPGGYVTIYQSLSDVLVKNGDEVKQGTLFAKSGTSELKKELGNHIHFEVREEGKAINPLTVLPQEEQ